MSMQDSQRSEEVVGKNGKLLAGPCYLKLLVPNPVAGGIIGKGGSALAALEADTGAVCRLSPSQVLFPGTNDRLLVAAGTQDALNPLLSSVVDRICDSFENEHFDENKYAVKFVVPNSAVSIVIGKGGETVKELSGRTGARISASPRSEVASIQERVITLSGPRDAVHAACEEVCEMVQDDPHLKEYMNVSGPFPDMGRAPPGAMPGAAQYQQGYEQGYGQQMNNGYAAQQTYGNYQAAAGGYQNQHQQMGGGAIMRQQFSAEVLNHTISIEVQFPDGAVGVIIGKGGAVLKEISIRSGAKVHISPKDQMEEGTQLRRVSISGTFQNVNLAHALMIQRMLEFPQHLEFAPRGVSQ